MRYAHYQQLSERLRSLLGIRPLRCRDCQFRFVDRTWRFKSLKYARCPKCWRMDLSLWAEENCYVSTWMSLLLTLGAKPYRCEYCRINFASFRPRFEKFTFKRWAKRDQESKPPCEPTEEAACGQED